MLSLVVLIVLLSSVEGRAKRSDDYRQEYLQTVAKYSSGLQSQSQEEVEEHYQCFRAFAQMVDDNNANPSSHYVAEKNQFSYETQAEHESHLGLNASAAIHAKRNARSVFVASKRDLEALEKRDEVNWEHKLPSIKNQGGCGSCWTFGAVAALEYQVNKDRTGTMKSLSEQQYLDCTYESTEGRSGCNGGWPAQCYTWSSQHSSHIASTAAYPYTGSDGACNYQNYNTAISGWSISSGTTYLSGHDDMLAAVADDRRGVMSVAITVVNSFYSYSSGVYSDAECTAQNINHAVDVVGYGTTSDGLAYWRVRNSWGSWGDNGYINMERGSNMCRINEYAHYPVVSGADDGGSSDDEDNNNNNDDSDSGGEWCVHANKYLSGYSGGSRVGMSDLAQAKSACGSRSDCGGVTEEPNTEGPYTLREGSTLLDSSSGETSYIAGACEGDDGDDGSDGNEVCEDAYSSCSSWADDYNYCCESYEDWMAENCAVSCGTCGGETAQCGGDEEVCEDVYSSCGSWASDYNYCCETYQDWMSDNCPVSCGTCGGVDAVCEEEEVCEDYYSNCPSYANDYGYCCHSYTSWMATNCAASCGTCGGAAAVCSGAGDEDPCIWVASEGTRLAGAIGGLNESLETAKILCIGDESCAGVSCKGAVGNQKCGLRSSASTIVNSKFVSYRLQC